MQIFLAGRGAFGVHGSAKLDDQKSFDPHRALGEIIGLVAILMLLCALVVWRNRALIGYTFALAFMAEILQHALALPKHPWIAGFHALDGIAILGLGRRGSLTGLGEEARRPRRRDPGGAVRDGGLRMLRRRIVRMDN